MNQMAVQDR
jgi:hypothetical protein